MGSIPHEPSTKTDKAYKVAVIGGGIGGLSCALGLMKHKHIDVQVYESAHAFGEIGAGIALGPNAQRALELIGPGPLATFEKMCTGNLWATHANNYSQYRMATGPHENEVVADQRNSTGLRSVHRARFLEGFVDMLPPQIAHFNKRLVGIDQPDGEGKPMTMHFRDGTTAETDAIIGADGIHSYVRSYILGKDHPCVPPQFTGTVAYRGLVPMNKVREMIGDEFAENSQMWMGPDRVIMTYPIDHYETVNIVFIDTARESWDDEKWVVPVGKEVLNKLIEGWGETAHQLVELMASGDLSAWAMYDMRPAPVYNKGNVAMMGDAAHASTPYQGQGASQAIEDALVLETLLGEVKDKKHIPLAFAAYDEVRRPRTQRCVTTSRESGDLTTMKAPGVGDDISKIRSKLVTRMHWLWNRDLVAQNKHALALLKEAV